MFEDLGIDDNTGPAGDDPLHMEDEGLIEPSQSTLCLGHDHVEKELLALLGSGKMPHALIFAGPEGIGKATFAYRFTRFLLSGKAGVGSSADASESLFGDNEIAPVLPDTMDLCSDDPLISRIAAGGHPDFRILKRREDERTGKLRTTLDLEEIREIPNFMHMTPAEGGWRVTLIDEADKMNRFSQNALLKILEEPPGQSILILVTSSTGALIPTIRSRSRVFNFTAPDQDHTTQLLEKLDPAMAQSDRNLLKALCGGQIGLAQKYYDTDGIKSFQAVLSSLANWPKVNWDDVYALSNQLGQKGKEASYECFRDSLLWLLQELVTSKAKNAPQPLIDIDITSLNALYQGCGLKQLIALYDDMHRHFNEADKSFLDKRQTVLNSYFILSNAEI